MRAFVTGASGFIGNNLVEELIRKKWSVRILLHKRNVLRAEKCEIVKGDIADFDSLKEAFKGTEILFHLAAALGASLIGNEEFLRINAQGTENVLKAAREVDVKKVIHFSSAGVLGSVKKNEIADEDYPVKPKDAYDKSKLEGERIAFRFAEEGMDIVIVRPGWVYGAGDSRTFKLIQAIAKKKFMLVTKGTARQTPVYIDDLIRGVILCALNDRKGKIYHLAGNEVLSVKEIVETIASVVGEKIVRLRLPLFVVKSTAWSMEKVFRLFKSEAPLTMGKLAFFIHPKPLAITKAGQELQYSPEIDFQTGMEQTVEWYRKNKWLD